MYMHGSTVPSGPKPEIRRLCSAPATKLQHLCPCTPVPANASASSLPCTPESPHERNAVSPELMMFRGLRRQRRKQFTRSRCRWAPSPSGRRSTTASGLKQILRFDRRFVVFLHRHGTEQTSWPTVCSPLFLPTLLAW